MSYDEKATAGSDPSEEMVLIGRPDPGIIVLTLHAPRKRNALTGPIRRQLKSHLAAAMEDEQVEAVVLTGSGDVFSAGGDIATMGQPVETMMERLHVLHDVVRLILRGPKPVVAAVSGPAFGAGWSLALACDWIVCAPSARFSAAFSRLSLMPDCGILWTLPQRVGERRAMQHFIRADAVEAPAALAAGIVDEIAGDDVVAAAVARARDLTRTAPLAVAEIKRHYADSSLDAALERESEAQRRSFMTQDHAEAVAAFRAKRPPRFARR